MALVLCAADVTVRRSSHGADLIFCFLQSADKAILPVQGDEPVPLVAAPVPAGLPCTKTLDTSAGTRPNGRWCDAKGSPGARRR